MADVIKVLQYVGQVGLCVVFLNISTSLYPGSKEYLLAPIFYQAYVGVVAIFRGSFMIPQLA